MNIRKVQREQISNIPSTTKRNFFLTSLTPDLLFIPSIGSRNSLLSPAPRLHDPLLASDEKYKEMKRTMTRAKEALLKDIQSKIETQTTQNPENFFHKSKQFIQRKQKIKENVKNHKYSSCEKLSRVKSIVEYDNQFKEFITKDDMLNGEAVEFLNLNKRKFGQAKNSYILFRSQKKKGDKVSTKIASLPDLHVKDLNLFSPSSRIKVENGVDKKISHNVKNFISKEMKKLWPPETGQIYVKKGKILKAKIDKLEDILDGEGKGNIEDEILKGLITTRDKMKMDEMVNQHFRKLRKKLTVFA